jgi:curli biogenesis system outer membrane secretion channel CsgG
MGLLMSLTAVVLAAPPGAAQAQTQARPRVAVMNFQNNSAWTWWGNNLGEAAADELVTQLIKTGKFSVIERAQLATVLQEQSLGASGAVTPSTAAKIGQLLGAQLILTGSITQFSIERQSAGFRGIGGSYSKAESKLDVRLVDTTTGEVLLAEEGTGEKRMGGGFFKGASAERTFDRGAAAEALRPAVEDIVKKLSAQSVTVAAAGPPVPAGQIVGARDGSFYINKGESSGIRVGQRFSVRRVVDEIKDADGKVLDRITKDVGVLEVTQVLSQSAVCKVVEGQAAQGDAIAAR